MWLSLFTSSVSWGTRPWAEARLYTHTQRLQCALLSARSYRKINSWASACRAEPSDGEARSLKCCQRIREVRSWRSWQRQHHSSQTLESAGVFGRGARTSGWRCKGREQSGVTEGERTGDCRGLAGPQPWKDLNVRQRDKALNGTELEHQKWQEVPGPPAEATWNRKERM